MATEHQVDVVEMPARHLAAVAHRGNYRGIKGAFDRLNAILTERELWPKVGLVLGVYYDDPMAVPETELRSHAGAEIDGPAPEGLESVDLEGGRFAVMHYRGPYDGLPQAWGELFGTWLPQSGMTPREAPMCEVYLNGPHEVAPEDLLTDLCLPIR